MKHNITVSGMEIPQSVLDGLDRKAGKRFESGSSLLTTSGLNIDPRISALQEEGRTFSQNSLKGIRGAREGFIGDRNTFVQRRTQGLRSSLSDQETNLGVDLEKRGVGGVFGDQAKENFRKSAEIKIKSGESLALDELLSFEGNFDRLEGGALEVLNRLDVNNFTNELQAKGLSQQLVSRLKQLELGQGQIAGSNKARKQSNIGTALVIAASIFSSRSFKHDMKEVDSQQVLNGVMTLDVEKWKYNGEDQEHIGCYAEDFNKLFGVEGDKTIQIVDIVGVLMASIQAQQKQIEALMEDK